MEDVKNYSGQNMGIAALITAIIAFVLAVIPCVGIIAIIPGIVTIVLASVGMSQAARNTSPRGLLIAGLIIGIVATLIAFSQVFVATKIAHKADNWPREIQNVIKDVQDNVTKDLEDAKASIKIESNGEKIEITTSSDKQEREKQLEDLEKTNTAGKDSTKQKK
jgi:phosphate/sulfate permease